MSMSLSLSLVFLCLFLSPIPTSNLTSLNLCHRVKVGNRIAKAPPFAHETFMRYERL